MNLWSYIAISICIIAIAGMLFAAYRMGNHEIKEDVCPNCKQSVRITSGIVYTTIGMERIKTLEELKNKLNQQGHCTDAYYHLNQMLESTRAGQIFSEEA